MADGYCCGCAWARCGVSLLNRLHVRLLLRLGCRSLRILRLRRCLRLHGIPLLARLAAVSGNAHQVVVPLLRSPKAFISLSSGLLAVFLLERHLPLFLLHDFLLSRHHGLLSLLQLLCGRLLMCGEFSRALTRNGPVVRLLLGFPHGRVAAVGFLRLGWLLTISLLCVAVGTPAAVDMLAAALAAGMPVADRPAVVAARTPAAVDMLVAGLAAHTPAAGTAAAGKLPCRVSLRSTASFSWSGRTRESAALPELGTGEGTPVAGTEGTRQPAAAGNPGTEMPAGTGQRQSHWSHTARSNCHTWSPVWLLLREMWQRSIQTRDNSL